MSQQLTIYTESPAAALESAFELIHRERMADIPLLNPKLSVAAVGFQQWDGHWVGVLITPWFLNLMLLPGNEDGWPGLAVGERINLDAPSGEYDFTAGHEDSIGEYLFCSLMSPVNDIHDQASALDTANEVMRLFMLPAEHREMALQDEAVPSKGQSRRHQHEQRSVTSRRDFLRGNFRGSAR